MKIPYNHGKPPFVAFPYEVKDPGYYSSRGVVEQVAVFESELCKLLNSKNDCMTMYNRPLYRHSQRDPKCRQLENYAGADFTLRHSAGSTASSPHQFRYPDESDEGDSPAEDQHAGTLG